MLSPETIVAMAPPVPARATAMNGRSTVRMTKNGGVGGFNGKNLRKLLPFLKVIVDIISTLLEAYLPQISLIVFLAVLPSILMFLSKAEGIPSESHAVRATSGKYFYFTALNVFIGVNIGGMLFSMFMLIEKEPNRIINLLASSLPGNATFFLTYVALQYVMMAFY
ncbi:hypothetical protein Droror1_Dr00002281 [Drosera rotundifolia]